MRNERRRVVFRIGCLVRRLIWGMYIGDDKYAVAYCDVDCIGISNLMDCEKALRGRGWVSGMGGRVGAGFLRHGPSQDSCSCIILPSLRQSPPSPSSSFSVFKQLNKATILWMFSSRAELLDVACASMHKLLKRCTTSPEPKTKDTLELRNSKSTLTLLIKEIFAG